MSAAAVLEAEAPAKDARAPLPFAFGGERPRPVSAVPALERIGERMARRLRDALEPLARAKPKVEDARIVVDRFAAWRGAQPEFTSVSLYRFRPLKGGVLLAIPPELVVRLVDSFYGGSGAAPSRPASEFTRVEERVLTRLSDIFVAVLTGSWAEVKPVQMELVGRETNASYANLVRPDEPVAIARFAIAIGQSPASTVEIIYPVSALRAIEAELAAKAGDDSGATNYEWRSRIADALAEVRIETRSVLARPTLSVLDLLNLKPGDVIPISLPATVPLNVGGQTVAFGTIGENEGRAALRIEKLGKGSKS